MRARGGRLPHGRLGPAALRRGAAPPAACVGLAELKALLGLLVVAYLGVAGLLWLSQESLMFFPRPAAAQVQPPPGWRLEEVIHDARDGTRLAGVLLLPPRERPPLIVYFGGNAEEVTEGAAAAGADYGERAVLLVNYRGYGRSAGRPGEKAMLSDALEVHDWAARHPAVDGARIAVHGRSLGCAMAMHVAAERPVRAVVLTSPFASAVHVASGLYPWLPVGWLMRHRFDSTEAVRKARAPALVLLGTADTIIKPGHSERVAASWGGSVERAAFEGFGHNDLQLHPGYAARIRAFLDRHL